MEKSIFFLLALTMFANTSMAENGVPEKLDALLDLIKPKTIFITSTFHNGNLGGLEGADQLCQGLANASSVVPKGEYLALLSTDDTNAASRIAPSVGPYIRPDGLPLAANSTALFNTKKELAQQPDLNLVNGPHMNEKGEIQGGDGAWTGSNGRGRRILNSNCANWNDGTVNSLGTLGSVSSPSSEWLETSDGPSSQDCDLEIHIYCVQR